MIESIKMLLKYNWIAGRLVGCSAVRFFLFTCNRYDSFPELKKKFCLYQMSQGYIIRPNLFFTHLASSPDIPFSGILLSASVGRYYQVGPAKLPTSFKLVFWSGHSVYFKFDTCV